MKLKTMKIQDCKGSCIVYIPKIWASEMGLKKGDKVTWSIEEGDLKTIHLKKEAVESYS